MRFPNLDVETLLLVAQTSMISLSGQGYCEVEQKRFGVNVSAYGVTVFIPIEHVEVELGAFRRRARR